MKRTKGSALLWAIVVVMVLSVAVAGAMTVSYTYYRRSINNNNTRQAYLTSKNVIENIVENIKSNDESYLSLFTNLQEGEVAPLIFTMPTTMSTGVVEGDITMLPKEETKGLITIRVKATYLEQSYTMKADMQLGRLDDGVENWQLLRYYKYDDSEETIDNNKRAAQLYADMIKLLNTNTTDGYSAVKTLMQSDLEGWKNFTKNAPADRIEAVNNKTYFDDTSVCYYLYYKNDPAGYEEFDISELSDEAQQKIKKIYSDSKLYIRAKYGNGNKMGYVYANKVQGDSGFSDRVRLFYSDGHWYFVDKVVLSDIDLKGENKEQDGLSPTMFDGKEEGNDGTAKWARFKAKYLVEANRIS